MSFNPNPKPQSRQSKNKNVELLNDDGKFVKAVIEWKKGKTKKECAKKIAGWVVAMFGDGHSGFIWARDQWLEGIAADRPYSEMYDLIKESRGVGAADKWAQDVATEARRTGRRR